MFIFFYMEQQVDVSRIVYFMLQCNDLLLNNSESLWNFNRTFNITFKIILFLSLFSLENKICE